MMHVMRNTPNRTHAQELVALRMGRPVAEVLHDLYTVQGRSQESIAVELGVTRTTLARWLRDFGIIQPRAVA